MSANDGEQDPVIPWESAITSNRESYVATGLRNASQFLDHCRHSKGWSALPGMGYDRHVSALAMEALWEVDSHSSVETSIAVAAKGFRAQYDDHYDQLGPDALLDVIHLVRPAIDVDDDAHTAISHRGTSLLRNMISTIPPDVVRRVSGLAVALDSISAIDDDLRREIVGFLVSRQDHAAGSWSIAESSEASLVVTTEALRALSQAGELEEAVHARRVAGRYIAAQARALTRRLGSADSWEIVSTIRALATFDTTDYRTFIPLTSELLSRQHEDGACASGRDRPPTAEPTAGLILALSAAFGFDYVPQRLASSILREARDLQSQLESKPSSTSSSELQAELSAAQAKIRAQTSDLDELQHEVAVQRRMSSPVLYERELLSATHATRTPVVLGAIVGLAVVASTVVASLFDWSLAPRTLATGFIAIILAGGLSLIFLRTSARRSAAILQSSNERAQLHLGEGLSKFPEGRFPLMLSSSNLTELRLGLHLITQDWPPFAREELVYLLRELLDTPPDVAGRRAEQIALELGVSTADAVQFSRWAEAAGLLSIDEQRVLFGQVRRILH